MKQLSALDAAFLFLETPKAPMHISALHIFSAADKKSASFQAFRERVQARLHLAPVLRQKLIHIPFDLDAPYLIDDSEFSLSTHLSHIGLPSPGNRQALNDLTAQIHRKPLDKQNPLWELTFIDNMTDIDTPGRYRFAIISKVHHAIVDGMGGEELLSKLLDFSPEPHERTIARPYKPKKPPTPIELFIKSYGSALKSPTKMIQILAKASTAVAQILAQKSISDLKKLTSINRAPATPFERSLSDDRVISTLTLPLSELKRCRTLCKDATIHDVVLGIIASGLRQYLLNEETLPQDNLVALVPVSLRSQNTQKNLSRQAANQITAMLIELATSDMSIVERITTIQNSTATSKTLSKKTKISQLTEFLPNIYLSIAAKLYTRWHISNHHNPLFNLVITNVPGPQIPLYMGKAKLQEQYGNAPIFHGMGLSIAVLSYNGELSITINSCSSIMSNPNLLSSTIEKCFHELSELAKPKAVTKPKQTRRKKPRTLTQDESEASTPQKSEKNTTPSPSSN